MPLHTIMTAAKTVSRASPAFSAGAAIMTETISAVSIDRYGQGEDKRAKWLAHAVRNYLGVVHGREHGG